MRIGFLSLQALELLRSRPVDPQLLPLPKLQTTLDILSGYTLPNARYVAASASCRSKFWMVSSYIVICGTYLESMGGFWLTHPTIPGSIELSAKQPRYVVEART
jgi:hypothetical protein